MKNDLVEESKRWMLQAENDLDDAHYCLKGKRYNLVCFLSHQAGEKALKSYLYFSGLEIVWGYSISELCSKASSYDIDYENIRIKVSSLDKYYIPTRYPNGLPGGIPSEAFDEDDAKKSLKLAQELIELTKKKISEPN